LRDDKEFKVTGTAILVKNNDIGRALRKLKKKMQIEKIFQELKMRESFEKPSLERKRKRAAAVKRWQKTVAMRDK